MKLRTKTIAGFLAFQFILVFSGPGIIAQIIDPGVPGDLPPATNPDTGIGNQGGGAGSISDIGDGNLDLSDSLDVEISEDTRNQGFIGATAAEIQELGFIGAASDNSGPPLADGATFGGGVNNSVTSGVGRGGGGGNQGGQGQGFGATGTQNGFTVTRRNLRARLRPSYTVPRISPREISNRFNNRFYRLPQSDDFAGQFSIQISNRTATVTGAVRSQEHSDRILRQLRLEPGIYRIDNQLRIVN